MTSVPLRVIPVETGCDRAHERATVKGHGESLSIERREAVFVPAPNLLCDTSDMIHLLAEGGPEFAQRKPEAAHQTFDDGCPDTVVFIQLEATGRRQVA